MEIDRHVKFLGTLVDRPEFLEVEELPVRHAVQHCPLAAEVGAPAAALGSAVGSEANAAKRLGFAAQTLARRLLTSRVSSAAISAPSFWVDGAPCERTWMSMPASSISLRRRLPRS